MVASLTKPSFPTDGSAAALRAFPRSRQKAGALGLTISAGTTVASEDTGPFPEAASLTASSLSDPSNTRGMPRWIRRASTSPDSFLKRKQEQQNKNRQKYKPT